MTADDRPALVFGRREGSQLRLLLSWTLDPATAIVLDEVSVPPSVATLSEVTHFEVSVTKDGEHGLGVAWRPLTEHNPKASWKQSAEAEVRWVTVEPAGVSTPVQRTPSMARPLMGHSGIGPWGPVVNRAKGRAIWSKSLLCLGRRHDDPRSASDR
jgi:hypothetical protein